MYIIELFIKIKEEIKQSGGFGAFLKEKTHRKPAAGQSLEDDEAENKCEHIFSAVDSTNTILACTKCGFLIHTNPEDLKKKNIFEGEIED